MNASLLPVVSLTILLLLSHPIQTRANHIDTSAEAQSGLDDCVYVISGRRENGGDLQFLRDVWEYTPRTDQRRQRENAPRSTCAGTGIGFGQSHLFVLSGDDGSLFDKTDELKDGHPGFRKEAFAFHTITNTWASLESTPQNQVTTTPVQWGDRIVIASGEVRPRVRTPEVWSIAPVVQQRGFGWFNYIVLSTYLLAMVGVGVFFAHENKTTDDYFRGGKNIPRWAAGCSIFATMLGTLTFTGLPPKSYAQNWMNAIGNFMIPVVAFARVYIALPFYRRIDATSAYEHLEKTDKRFPTISFRQKGASRNDEQQSPIGVLRLQNVRLGSTPVIFIASGRTTSRGRSIVKKSRCLSRWDE